MLNKVEKLIIHEKILSCEHDYFVWSSILGEPFIIDGFMCYFDGITTAVAGVPVIDEKPAKDPRKRLNRVIEEWMKRQDVTFINYFGPEQLIEKCNNSFDLIYKEKPNDYNVDLFIKFDLTPDIRLARKQRQDVNRAVRNGIIVNYRKQEFLTAEQLKLISALAHRADLGVSDVSYLANAVTLIRDSSTTVFESKFANTVVGVGIAHNYYKLNPFFVLAAFDHEPPGISDAIYSTVISYYEEQGAHSLGLGYAASPTQYRYKKKWGAEAKNPPCCQMIWKRNGVDIQFRDSLHWPWRFLIDKWSSLQNLG